jgi:hypothetical protein
MAIDSPNTKCAEAMENVKDCASREKYWDELSIEEKIERTRMIVRQTIEVQSSEIISLRNRLYEYENKFDNHRHDGKDILVNANCIHRNQTVGDIIGYNKHAVEEKRKFF